MNRPRILVPALAAIFLLALAAQPAAAVCTPFLCYVDLANGGGSICGPGFTPLQSHPVVTTSTNPTCNTSPAAFRAVVVKVDLNPGCSGVAVLVEYEGEPEGFTVNIGDSETNNGFAGDSGSVPIGQNAEVQILHEDLAVYSAASAPPVDQIGSQHLALKDGAIQFVIKDQFVSWGQPYSALATPSLNKLFFLPATPTAPDNHTIYVGLNRVIHPIGGQDTFRNGCGARRALLVMQ